MRRLSYVLALIAGVLTLNVSCQDRAGSMESLTPELPPTQGRCHFGSQPLDDMSTLDPSAVSGKLTVYTFIPPKQYETYLKDFYHKCPNIEIDIVYGTAGQLAQRLLSEKLAPQADVIWGLAVPNLILLEWQDLLYPYHPVDLEQIRPAFRDSNKPPYWVGFDAWMVGICVDPAQLQQQGLPFPIAWSDLTNPVYQDQIILYDPLLTGTGFMMITHMLQRYGEVDGWAFLDALHHNIASYTRAGEEPCALVAAGQKPIGISYALEGIDLKAKGKPIELVFPVGLSNWDMEASALVKKEPIQPAAKTFLDWTISKTAMQGYAKNYSLISRQDVEVRIPEGYPQEPGRQLFDRDFLWDAANRQRILKTLRERYSDKVPKNPDSGKPS